MSEQEFHLEVTGQSVFVRLTVNGKTRFRALIFFAVVAVLVLCASLFLPGKHDRPSMWHDISTSSVGSSNFLVPIFLLSGLSVFMVFGTRRYVKLAYPSDETFSSDRSTLRISRVRWLDVRNKEWDAFSFALSEVQGIRYEVIASLGSVSIYGLLFSAAGKTWRVLPGLKPRDAETILKSLKAFGADLSDDSLLQRKLKEDTFQG